MKNKLEQILRQSCQKWEPLPAFEIERPKAESHGELSTNLAMLLAKALGRNPKEVAQEILNSLVDSENIIEKSSIAGPGFLNFTLKKSAWQNSLKDIVSADKNWGKSPANNKKVLIEFVSANPTGPLHIGNARGGPLGDVLASLLEHVGYKVTREYYMNDVGGQIDKLGESIQARIDEIDGKSEVGKDVGYQGEYVKELAQKLKITKKSINELGRLGLDLMTQEIRKDCEEMGIKFDSWIHEKDILEKKTPSVLNALQKKKVTLEKEGAVWLAPDDDFLKDRECVLVRTDGRPTYFANDIAYHVDKYERKFDRMINVWGSNHHGHVPRIQAALKALGWDPEKLHTILYQYVRVKRGQEAVKMSKRGGNFVTAREVLDEAGRDAFRFFLLMRAPESHLDFDLDLARSKAQENPVYYVQYAHARLASLERKAVENKMEDGEPDLSLLNLPEEIEMIRRLHEYPEEIRRAAERLEPHRIPFYLVELTRLFQSYYSKSKENPDYRILTGDVDTSRAKMYLGRALKLTISQGLKLLGVSAPDKME